MVQHGYGGRRVGNGEHPTTGGEKMDLTPGEFGAIVLSCTFGPGIVWMVFALACMPIYLIMRHAREKRKAKQLQRNAALSTGTGIPLGEQGDPMSRFGGGYYSPTASVIASMPPAASGH